MKRSFTIEPTAAVLWGLLFYLSEPEQLLILLPPVLVHEAGHCLAMHACGVKADSLRLQASGLCMRYHGSADGWEEIMIAAAGPLFGLLFAAVLSLFPGRGQVSAGISLLLSMFNLIPAQPLDGGRIAAALLKEKAARALSIFSAVAAFTAGAALCLKGKGAALLLAGCFLLTAQLRRDL